MIGGGIGGGIESVGGVEGRLEGKMVMMWEIEWKNMMGEGY